VLHKPGKRPRAAVPATAPADRGRHGGVTNRCELLPQHDVDQLIDGACELLRDTGCAFEPGTEAIELFKAAGCQVHDDGVVRFAPELVRDAIATTAKSATLWDRTGEHGIGLDLAHTWFMPGMTAIRVCDLATGEARDSTGEDLATITRVADALPNIDGVCVACKNVARPDIYGEIAEFTTLIQNTTKPLEYLCENVESFVTAIDMAAAVRGSRQALEEKPYFLQIVTPLPLAFWGRTSR
jgi:trimethylamine--corrinoid protein Co-methyltransferase